MNDSGANITNPQSAMMKPFRRRMRTSALLGFLAAQTLGALAFTVETPLEHHLVADFDGDGRADVVVVDRASGAYRVGYQKVAGKYTWAEARGSGIQDVTAVGAGRLLSLSAWQDLAFTGPLANRVVVQGGGALPLSEPVTVNVDGAGPAQLVPVDIAGLGVSPHDDLVVTTVFGPPNAPHALGKVRNLGGGILDALPAVGLGAELARLQQVGLVTNDVPRLAGLLRGGSKDTLVVWNPTNSPATPVATATVAGGGDYAFGRFVGGHGRHHFLSFRAGRTDFASVPVNLSPTNTLVLGAGVNLDFGRRVANLVVVPTVPNRLLVSFSDAAEALVYAFDGVTQPVEIQRVTPPSGERVSGMIAAADGSFLVYSSAPGGTSSGGFRHYAFNGTKHGLAGEGKLPAVNPQAANANLFLFAGEPFVAASPVLVRTLNTPDWTSKPDLSGATLKVIAERSGTSAEGLDNPAARDLGAQPATVTHALGNQYAPPISLASFQPAVGNTVVDFAVAPLPGAQNAAINVTLTALTPGATVVWRTSPAEPWASSPGTAIFPLYRDSTVEYYGRIGPAKSRIHRAAYQFPGAPVSQDSDGDGVPDFVELAKGLNPNGGSDSDGDGFTDKEELFAGTNPLDVNSPPANSPIDKVEENAAFNLLASPRPYDGYTPGEVAPRPAQGVHLHRLDGAFLGSEVTGANAGALFNPSARFADAPADVTQLLLAVSTDSHLQIVSANPTAGVVGRELLGLVPVPALDRPVFSFTPTAAPLAGQADDWIAAAKAAAASVPEPTVAVRFGTVETLAAVLVEHKVEEILVSRGENFPATNRLTLFASRPADVARRAATEAQLQGLGAFGEGGKPAWNLVTLQSEVQAALSAPGAAKLRKLAEEVFRVSSLSNNAAPGQYPLPADVLRAFADGAGLHSNYVAGVGAALSPADLSDAATTLGGLLAGLSSRPTNVFDLEVTVGSFQPGCTTLKLVNSSATRNLFVARGVPFKFPDSFTLLPGSRVRVLAFTDYEDPCPGPDLQVISAQLIAIPAPTLADSDGDLLPDDWECLFLGSVADDAAGDIDGDGISNLQEYFDGTDPKDAKSAAAAAEDLSPPALTLTDLGGGQLRLSFEFPASYAGKFSFTVLTGSDPGQGFPGDTLVPVALGGGKYELLLTADAASKFFLLQQLKPDAGSQLARRPTARF